MEEIVDTLQQKEAVANSSLAVEAKEAIASGDFSWLEKIFENGIDLMMGLASRIVLAIIVFFILRWIVGKLNKFVRKTL
jgi:hypothetical protein